MLQGYGQFLLHYETLGGVSLEPHTHTLTKHRRCS
jgi:hypothetical protein